ncbi:ABC transporter substrate-binding protein [Curvivirga aplysinae]|uniref:ABC transporter substrate-binding protein n=1 Tax=Curvivirga aplysinae TaxID=2529852 RepID=UPI001C3FECA3|nr:ABC transporter substrate-binding protein [Curvivirga aplysinae]
MKKLLILAAAAGLMSATAMTAANAETLRWARKGDSLTLDPHSQNEGATHGLAHQMYEPLLMRDMTGKIIPTLATEWAATDNPSVWEFKLREGVKFHNGEDFNADDVVFSIKRALMDTAEMRGVINTIKDARKVDDYTVHIETHGPNPLLPNVLTNTFMMDEGWTKSKNCEVPQDFKNNGDNACVRSVNGTGPYILVSRAQDEKTVLRANENYWGKGTFPLEVTEIIYTPIQEAATRVSALLAGNVDFIQDVPVQDLSRVEGTDGLKLETGAQNRVIFFGMNQGDADLVNDDVEGKNPLADVRVRQAMNMAINREAIKKVVMRGQSDPTGVIMPPFVNGWTEELDAIPPYDIAKAKGLMSDAGYADGFGITLHCPNNRYVNDEAICQAAVGMLGQIGIRVTLDAKPKAQHFPQITKRTTDFYMLGWGVPTFDSAYIFNFLMQTEGEKSGSYNGNRYSNPEIDKKIVALSSETNLDKRDELIADIWAQHQKDVVHLPIHNQVLNWGMVNKINFQVQPEDQPYFKFMTFN